MAKKEYEEVLDAHRSKLARLAERAGTRQLKKVYERAQRDMVAKIARTAGPMRGSFTAHVQNQVLAQLRQGTAVLSADMAGELGDISKEAQVESVRGLSRTLSRLETRYTGTTVVIPIEESARFLGVLDAKRTSLMHMHEESMASYGARLVGKMEEKLGFTLAEGGTTADAIDAIQEVADLEWWQAERIARTEVAWAYNGAHVDGMKASQEFLPDLMMRWTEYCSEDGDPLDDRVAVDSIAMHGQVADVGGMFVMPPTAPKPDARGKIDVPDDLVGEEWEFPPNRPNDRATILPWRKEWGVPGWRWDGRRVPL